jgi:hypothetical protein
MEMMIILMLNLAVSHIIAMVGIYQLMHGNNQIFSEVKAKMINHCFTLTTVISLKLVQETSNNISITLFPG